MLGCAIPVCCPDHAARGQVRCSSEVQSSGREDAATDASGIFNRNLGRQYSTEMQQKQHCEKEREECSRTMGAMQLDQVDLILANGGGARGQSSRLTRCRAGAKS